ncbi:hypothetical protein ISG33_16820 [Glaciecola sp. MH2013]|uniref:hypothetical protein n=1 Tax=Glaciecola sp. MH2013 TaxID=2785524 RepID=UPI00189FBA5D|nr:hypothetical protein [Glaciecola sp. MH2013]MBF7075067.1 hypothetical protein [Glaciecola sp. MH2013]
MSTAYFIIINDDIEYDTYVSGKNIAKYAGQLNQFCASHGLRTVDFFLYQDFSDFLDEDLGDSEHEGDEDDQYAQSDQNIADAPEDEQVWFDPQQGLDWLDSLRTKLNSEQPAFSSQALLDELQEYREVLEKTRKAGAMWHLEMDF